MSNKQQYLWRSQYGDTFSAATLKELKQRIPGRVSKMYIDGPDGKAIHIGYVIGPLWLTRFAPCPFSKVQS